MEPNETRYICLWETHHNISIVVISFNKDDKGIRQYTVPDGNLDKIATKVAPQILLGCPFVDDVHTEKLMKDSVILWYFRMARGGSLQLNFKYNFLVKLSRCLADIPNGYYKIIKWKGATDAKEYILVKDTFKMK